MDSCNLTNKANSHTPKVEIHTRKKSCHLGRHVSKAKLFCLTISVPVTRKEWPGETSETEMFVASVSDLKLKAKARRSHMPPTYLGHDLGHR